MKMNHVRLVLDLAMATLGLSVVLTGLLIATVLPPGSRQASVAGWTRHDWGDVHLYAALGLLALAMVHLALNWAWVCNVIGRACGRRAMSPWRRRGVGLAVLLTLGLGVAGLLVAADAVKVDDARAHASHGEMTDHRDGLTRFTGEGHGPRRDRHGGDHPAHRDD